MNGAQIPSPVSLGQGAVGFELVAAADFNGDGKADTLWSRASDQMLAIQFSGGAWTQVGVADAGFGLVTGNHVPTKSAMTSPTPGSTLQSSSVTFTWTAGSGMTSRYLEVGNTLGGTSYYAGYVDSTLSQLVSGLPTDGSTVYVRLMSYINGNWQYYDYTYTAMR